LSRVKIVLFTLLALGAAAVVAAQSSVPLPAQEAGQESTPTPARPTGCSPASLSGQAPPDAAAVERGHQIFSANCSFCHGSDARGGEGGPNLIRSQLVMDDDMVNS